ncbi:MAG: hypothetical protein KA319_09960 [Ferruginibacter sp.]|nr:hypothetical protein [Ferruginibacter sp.]
MNTAEIFESIFKRNSNDIYNLSFLQEVAQEHPYFSAAQFYLLQQTHTDNDEYKNVAAKTALHFNNPLWLNYLLNKEDKAEEITLQNNVATVAQNQKKVAEEEPNNAENVQVSDTTMLNSSTEAKEQKETQPLDIKVPTTLSAEQMLFEPMHMVDYFASQGIKLSEDMLKGDKLGKQLKSFTEWLKVMKKVHPDKLPQNTDVLVQNLAEKSNKEGEIVTEAMAEVLAMQGKHNKAIEVYEKLSLINPAESAYLAAKILQLKG